jgi:hypothetical protein
MNIDPSWISSSLLAMIGALLIVTCVLALLLIDGKTIRTRIEATLASSVARHKVVLREHRTEIEMIEAQHQVQLANLVMTHSQELDGMRGILAISDLSRDEALRNTDAAIKQAALLRNQLDEIHVFMESCSAGTDETALAVRHQLFQIHSEAC